MTQLFKVWRSSDGPKVWLFWVQVKLSQAEASQVKTSDGPKVWLCLVVLITPMIMPGAQAFNQVNLPDPTLNGLKVEGG